MRFNNYLQEEVTKIPKILDGLAAEARKYRTFEDFQNAFLGQIKHGRYYHITQDPAFKIDPSLGPRDMSSMGDGKMTPGYLMITSHLENWMPGYANRKYVAIIDMSEVPEDKYRQVNRGFGNEFWVSDPSKAKVLKVVSRSTAQSDSRRYQSALESLIKSPDDLEQLYNLANGLHEEYVGRRYGGEIFVNPTAKEIKSIKDDYLRCLVDFNKKDLYVWSHDMTHSDILWDKDFPVKINFDEWDNRNSKYAYITAEVKSNGKLEFYRSDTGGWIHDFASKKSGIDFSTWYKWMSMDDKWLNHWFGEDFIKAYIKGCEDQKEFR